MDISDNDKTPRVVRASEIAQFEFCSMYHYLSRNGAEIDKDGKSRLNEGSTKHIRHGIRINFNRKMNRLLSYLILSVVGVLVSILLFSFLHFFY